MQLESDRWSERIVVAAEGLTVVGEEQLVTPEFIEMKHASLVPHQTWPGELALNGQKKVGRLDLAGLVRISQARVIFDFPCDDLVWRHLPQKEVSAEWTSHVIAVCLGNYRLVGRTETETPTSLHLVQASVLVGRESLGKLALKGPQKAHVELKPIGSARVRKSKLIAVIATREELWRGK